MRYPEIAKRFQLILDLRKMKARDTGTQEQG